MRAMADPLPHLFTQYRPFDLLEKLKREKDRYDKARTRPCQEDHIANFAATAWNFHERLWESIEALPPEERERYANETGADTNGPKEFRDWCKDQLPDLGGWRQITNTTKHFAKATDIGHDEVPVDVTARPTDSAAAASLIDIAQAENWSIEIKYLCDWVPAAEAMERVIAFWMRMMAYGKGFDL